MWYGVNCSQRCVGHCKDNDSCNHVTGQCDGGCDAGWTQSACNKDNIISLLCKACLIVLYPSLYGQ